MPQAIDDLLAFLDAAPTPYHAVAETARRLAGAGFRALREEDAWTIAAGDRVYVVRGGASLIALAIGTASPVGAGFRLVGAHSDSPNLRLKPRADLAAHGYRQLAVEPYGGLLLHTWLDRDLSLAGQVSIRMPRRIETALVDIRRPLLRIPSLAIHLYRELTQNGLKLNPQQHAVPIVGLGDSMDVTSLIVDALRAAGTSGIDAADVLAYDLMLYDTQPAAVSGAGGEFIQAARLDNLASCHAALAALTQGPANGGRAGASRGIVLYDHEEVGSRSARGAAGSFLADTLARVVEASGDRAPQALARTLARSSLVSLDMAHAVHPSYANRHEPGHRPVIGGGPVLKRNAGLSYATDAETAGRFHAICRDLDITPQHYVVRSDLPCGSTIGPITAARVGIRTVDVGNPMLSMHSCREMAGTADVEPMIRVLRASFDAP